MPPSHVSPKRVVFAAGLAVAIFSTTTMAATSSTATAELSTASTLRTFSTLSTSSTQSSEASAKTTTTAGETTSITSAVSAASATSVTSTASAASATSTTGTVTSGSDSTMSTITSSSSISMPTLSTTNTAVPTYPAPSVPPTADAPFMRHSNLPDGTVFIIVGAILGAFGAAIIIWRVVVAYLLHRSISRAALAQHLADDKAPFSSASNMPLYKYSDHDSTLYLGGGGFGGGPGGSGGAAAGRGVRRTNRGPTPSSTPSQTNLFFSPTAPGSSGAGNNRDSRLLSPGIYTAGSGTSAGAPHGQHGQHSYSISMTNLRPESLLNTRHAGGSSPPDSPNFGPLRASAGSRNMSGSSISLNRPPSGRAPSAFLDDLLDEQPHLFPSTSTLPHDYPHDNHPGRY